MSRKTTSGCSASSAREHLARRRGTRRRRRSPGTAPAAAGRRGAPPARRRRSGRATQRVVTVRLQHISRYGTRSVARSCRRGAARDVERARSPYSARSRSRVFSRPWPVARPRAARRCPAPSSSTVSSSMSPSRRAVDPTAGPHRCAARCRGGSRSRPDAAARSSGTAADSAAGSIVELRPQPIGEPRLLDGEVLPHQLELVLERDSRWRDGGSACGAARR